MFKSIFQSCKGWFINNVINPYFWDPIPPLNICLLYLMTLVFRPFQSFRDLETAIAYFSEYLQRYGSYKWYFFSERTSDQLNISWSFLSSLLCGCNSKATANPPKSVVKNGQEICNWSELHSEKKCYLYNPYFRITVFQPFQSFETLKLQLLT